MHEYLLPEHCQFGRARNYSRAFDDDLNYVVGFGQKPRGGTRVWRATVTKSLSCLRVALVLNSAFIRR